MDIALSTPWLVFALVLAGISMVMMFVPRVPASVVAYMALWAARLSGYAPFSVGTMLFWGAAVAIVLVNRFLLPTFIRNSTRGLGYIAAGAIVGMALGLTLYTAATVIGGSVLAAFFGALAYTRTRRGAELDFPTAKFFNYLGAKGIPAVVTASMCGLIFAALIARSIY